MPVVCRYWQLSKLRLPANSMPAFMMFWGVRYLILCANIQLYFQLRKLIAQKTHYFMQYKAQIE